MHVFLVEDSLALRAVLRASDLTAFVLPAQKYAAIEAVCKKCGADFVFEKSESHLARFAAVLPLVMQARRAS